MYTTQQTCVLDHNLTVLFVLDAEKSVVSFLICFMHFSVAAVRKGNLAQFNQVLENHGEKFQAEDTYILIIRLRHNVIKTGKWYEN